MIDFLVLAAIGGAWLVYRHLPLRRPLILLAGLALSYWRGVLAGLVLLALTILTAVDEANK